MLSSRMAELLQMRSLQVVAHPAVSVAAQKLHALRWPAVMTDLSALLTGLCPVR